MKLKVGDRLLCRYYLNPTQYKLFEKGKYYNITGIANIPSLKVVHKIVVGISDNNNNDVWFSDVYKYFYTKQEERKLKLKELEKETVYEKK